MAIDRSGKWWTGETPDDIREYLEAYAAGSYEVHEFRLARCTCGSSTFALETDDDEGVARRTCSKCSTPHFLCDSGEYWAEATPETCTCIACGTTPMNVGVGFSLYPDDPAGVRWLYIGVRCSRCGILGCPASWKVATADAAYLLDQV